MQLRRLFAPAMPAILLAGIALTALAAEPVAERKDGFKTAKRNSALIKDAIERGDHATVAMSARSLAIFAAKVPELFPAGSQGGLFSAAKDNIWINFPDFVQKSKALEIEAQELARLASTEPVDKGALLSAYKQLSNTCSACHQPYKRGF